MNIITLEFWDSNSGKLFLLNPITSSKWGQKYVTKSFGTR
jgi:hypothetical protein